MTFYQKKSKLLKSRLTPVFKFSNSINNIKTQKQACITILELDF